jgi:hypothetical protein
MRCAGSGPSQRQTRVDRVVKPGRALKQRQRAPQQCPADAVVWLNTSSANYHFKGDPWYGHTQRGTYVCKAEADKNGMRTGKSKMNASGGRSLS